MPRPKRGVLIRPSKAYLSRHRGAFVCPSCGVERWGVVALYARGPAYLMNGAALIPVCSACRYQFRRRKTILKLSVEEA